MESHQSSERASEDAQSDWSSSSQATTAPKNDDVDAPEFCEAQHDFSAASSSTSSSSCLSFQKGQIIQIITCDPSGWWWGQIVPDLDKGWFPSNYTKPCSAPLPPTIPSRTKAHLMEDHSDLASSKTATQKADSSKLLNVESGILALQRAAKDQSSNGYQASVSVVISGVRSLLSSYDCLARQTPVLLSHPLLVQLRRSILDVLATVVELARKCSSRLKSRDFEQYELDLVRMLQLSEEVLDFTQQFLTYAHENQIPSVEPTDKSIRGEGASTTPKSASKPAPQLQRHKTKSMGDLKTRRKLAEHAEQFQQISEATPRFTASNGSDASLWPPPWLSSAASSSDSLDGPKTPRDPKSQGTALDNLKDHLLSVIAAFIGHVHVHSRDSHASSYAHLVDIACEAVELVKELMAVVEELPAKSLDGGSCGSDAEDLASAREALYTSTNDLVTAVRIATDPPDPESEDSEDTEKATMLQSATRLLRSADSGVAHVKKCLHRSEAASKVFDLISHAPPYQNSAAEANTETAGKAKPDANPYHTAFLRERHTLSMLGRTADGLGHLKSRYEQGDAHPTTDPSSASDSESGRQPHSSHGSTASSTNQSNSESASVPQVRLQEFTPADIKPLNTLSNRRGQPSPTPLRIDTDAQPKKDPTPPSAFSASSVSQLQSAQSAQSAASAANSLANSGTSEETHRKESLQIEDALNRGYEAKEIMFNGDGQVTGGTLRCLVERMSLHDAPIDAGFAQAFFLTFRLFASPKDLTKALFSRFLLAPPERIAENSPEAQSWSRSVALPVKLRVINMFKTWLESHWQPETDGIILNPLADFAQEKIKPTNASAASRLIDLVQKRQYRPEELAQIQSLHQTVSNDRMRQGKPALDGVPLHLSTPMNEKFPATIFQVPPPPPAIGRMLLNACRSDTCTHISVTEFDPLEIARQLTIIDSRLFCMIQPKELFMQSKGKHRPSDSSNHVRQMSAQSTKITGWISEVILSEQDTKRRTQIMKWFLKLADRCHSLQNYNTLMAVLAALNSSTVARLRRTWEGLSAKYKMLLENLRKVTEHTRNYAEYRGALRRASQPALPFLGLYLTDLTFCHDGNPPTRTSSLDSSLKLINFDRYSKMTKIIADLQRFQTPYNLIEIPEVQNYLNRSLQTIDTLGGGDVDRLYRRSLVLEPRTSDAGLAPNSHPNPQRPFLHHNPSSRSVLRPLSPIQEKGADTGGLQPTTSNAATTTPTSQSNAHHNESRAASIFTRARPRRTAGNQLAHPPAISL